MSNIKKINSIFNGRMNKKIEEFSLKGQQQVSGMVKTLISLR